MDRERNARDTADLDLSMLGEADLAAVEKLLSTAAESDPESGDRLKAALAKARAYSVGEDPADVLLGQALMSGGVSCKDGIALFERGMGEDAKRFCVLAALPSKALPAAGLAKLVDCLQEAVAPGHRPAGPLRGFRRPHVAAHLQALSGAPR